MPLVLAGATSGQATVQATDAATVTLTLPATSGTLSVSGGSPSFATLTVTGNTNLATTSGNVGIGTASPTNTLDVRSTSATGQLALTKSSGGVDSYVRMNFGNSSAAYWQIASSPNATAGSSIFNLYSSTFGDVLQLLGNGKVGIGLSPTYKLDVYSGASGVVLNLQGVDAYSAETGIALSTGRAKISGVLNSGGGTPGANLVFYTTPDSGGITERVRISSAGLVSIGAAFAGSRLQSKGVGGVAAAAGLSPGNNGDGTLEWYNASSGYVGAVTVNASTVVYGGTSDYRLKKDIAPMTGALDKVAKLKPVTYKWKIDGEAGEGFIAHELQEVCPSAVVGEKDAVNEDGSIKPQEIDTSFLVATLTAAIQELNAKVTALEAQLAGAK